MSGKHKGEEYWVSVISDYHQRDCTQDEFCKRRDVKPATLQHHLSTARKKNKNSFIPLEIREDSFEGTVELEFPSGLRLCIRG